ncbi:hypothetical protein BC833DRAFT_163479 [Globomyces pollinis-pini]|nr:hypothetical protein BC833DRAFT_163479 [Globomyces pollinis-pini]
MQYPFEIQFVSETAQKVFVTGDFDDWNQTKELLKDGNKFIGTVHYDKPTLEFKFVVDGDWVVSTDYAMSPVNENNNVIYSPLVKYKYDIKYVSDTAQEVFVTGDFDAWEQTKLLAKDGNNFSGTVEYHEPILQFKFVADGDWVVSSLYEIKQLDDFQNNVLHSNSVVEQVISTEENAKLEIQPQIDTVNIPEQTPAQDITNLDKPINSDKLEAEKVGTHIQVELSEKTEVKSTEVTQASHNETETEPVALSTENPASVLLDQTVSQNVESGDQDPISNKEDIQKPSTEKPVESAVPQETLPEPVEPAVPQEASTEEPVEPTAPAKECQQIPQKTPVARTVFQNQRTIHRV